MRIFNTLALALLVILGAAGDRALAQTDDLAALNAQVAKLFGQGKYAEATPIAERYVARAQNQLGAEDAGLASAMYWLAALYRAQVRYAEAESLFKSSLAIREKALGPGHPNVAAVCNNLASLYEAQGRYPEAEPLYKRSLAIYEMALGPGHPSVASVLYNLAGLYRAESRYPEAEPLNKRSLAIREKALGPDHPDVASALKSLAELYRVQGRYPEAEPLLRRSLAIYETALGTDHPYVATALNSLAELYRAQGRYSEVEPLMKRSLEIREKTAGPDHPAVATALNNLALLYEVQGRYPEAEPLLKRSLAIYEKALGQDHPNVATALNNLAGLYRAQGRYPDAEPLLKRSLAISEKMVGPNHPNVAAVLSNLAGLYQAQDRYTEAEALLKRNLAIREKALGPDHPSVASALNNLAGLYLAQRDWRRAADNFRLGIGIVVRRTELGSDGIGREVTGSGKNDVELNGGAFRGLIKVVNRLPATSRGAEASSLRETFETAQWALGSEAAASLAQMAARGAKGDAKLAVLVRERQDLVVEWLGRDQARSAAVAQPPDKRDAKSEAVNVARLTAIDQRIAEIDATLVRQFPDYAALASPKPLSLDDVQANLRPDEALVLTLDTSEQKPTPEETFIWVVTKTDARWVRSDLGTPSLKREVAALRCGLDYEGSWDVKASACSELTKSTYTEADYLQGNPLPFDLARAYALYKALFGEVEDLIKDKHLLIVPSGAMTQLPIQVLVTEQPDPAKTGAEALRRAKWLIRAHALTVLPSVSSLKALRRDAKPSRATKAMVGFGNPLLDGTSPFDDARARQARANTACPLKPVEIASARRGVAPIELRGGIADVAFLRSAPPLPETADELCEVAAEQHAGADDIYLGARATETNVKHLSEAGELAKYRMLHFATHGALSGQVRGSSEPGLVLTPPATATELDDGYLSASEIAALKLDADWVILSACNTAAGGSTDAEALSGLARAFFCAGARSLLVSHWSVNSKATVKLITGAIGRMTSDPSIGRAEALRQSMLALIFAGSDRETHPATWAPFIVVGEGAASR